MKAKWFWIIGGIALIIIWVFYGNGFLSFLQMREEGFFLLKEGTQEQVDANTIGSANFWKSKNQNNEKRLSASLALPDVEGFKRVFKGDVIEIENRRYLVKKIYFYGIYPGEGRLELMRLAE